MTKIKIKTDSALPKNLVCLESETEYFFTNTKTKKSFVVRKLPKEICIAPDWLERK